MKQSHCERISDTPSRRSQFATPAKHEPHSLGAVLSPAPNNGSLNATRMNHSGYFFFILAIWLLFSRPVSAVQIDILDPTREWRVGSIEISGNQRLSNSRLLAEMLTQARPWYRFWEERPIFDPVTFETDLDRLRRFYESQGYYENRITHDLQVDEAKGIVSPNVFVEENEPIVISQVVIDIAAEQTAESPPSLPEKLPVTPGEIFTEKEYQEAELLLRNSIMDHGHAYTKTQRGAEVDLDTHEARIRYSAQPGPRTVFGASEVKGTEQVKPYLILRELAYEPGELFSLRKIQESRQQILALDLFSGLRINPRETAGTPTTVFMDVEVTEKPPREISAGIGYSTEEEFRASLNWRHNNWLGDGRRLSLQAKYSSIVATGAIEFLQPHFLTRRTQAGLTLRHDLQDEETFLRNVSQFAGRLDHRFSPRLAGSLGYRVEYNQLNDVSGATPEALGDIRTNGILTGPRLGLVWNTTDSLLDPTRGEVLSFTADQAGGIWGGQFDFYKLTTEAKKYVAVGWETILAGRLKIGVADAIGSRKNFPLFERFFSGGQASVRGFERRRLGPLNSDDEPLGGLSLIEGSIELRRPLWRELGGALFVDFGQVSLQPFDIPVDDVKFAAGFGLSYTTPLGPIRLDVGFPFKPPPGDQPWQIHFSIGASF
ncbi:MAG: outer membrane protein assembly factor BamA [Deltaproteobacteria bacterium]|nr:outer membrane protein assembly factor BamA [Deltaproteobacteria bacterium]